METAKLVKILIGVGVVAGAGVWLDNGGWDDLTRKGVRGASVYTATRDPKLEEELFVSSGLKFEIEADAQALASCAARIKGVPGLSCKKVTFLDEHTCMARFRVGNGHYTAEKSSLKSALQAAKFNCEASPSAKNPASSCIQDAEICGDASVAKLRHWGRAAMGVTKPYVTREGAKKLL
ncbi:MAG: hypothetical protein ACTSX7_15135, partial [Alphaproteobacteria bacterium]